MAGSDSFNGALEIPVCLEFIAEPGIQLVSAATGLPGNILSTATMGQVDDEKSAGAAGQVHTSER